MHERRDVIRTKKAIQEAYYRLLMEKGEERITVSEVLLEADVSRGTFYAHYRDIPDLAEQVENSIMHRFADYMREQPIHEILTSPGQQISHVLDFIEENKERLCVLLRNKKNPRMIVKFKEILIHAMRESGRDITIPSLTGGEPVSLLNVCLSGLLVDAMVYWLFSGEAMPREDISRYLSSIISGGLPGYMSELGVAV